VLARPNEPSNTGRAQQEAAPNADTSPPATSNVAPVSLAILRPVLGSARVLSVIVVAFLGRGSHAKACSHYRLKPFF
jgi:hypothetical protein